MSSIARVFAPRSVTILSFKGEDNEPSENKLIWARKRTFSRVRDTLHTAQGHVRRPRARWDLQMIAKAL
jgi:hypothetical protein